MKPGTPCSGTGISRASACASIPTGRKVYVVQSRGSAGPKRLTLGRHGDMPAEEARKRAAIVIARIKQGEDPLPRPPEPELTVSNLAERFMSTHVKVHCKPNTVATYRCVLNKYILPTLGMMPISDVGRKEISDLHHRLRDTPVMANRTVKLLSRMFSLAEAWERLPPGRNPCRAVRRYRERSRERFLTPEEFQRLGRVLQEAEADGSVWPPAIAAIRLLMLTGCRKMEILTLRWEDVDRTAGELRLRDAKAGPRMAPLTPAVGAVLDAIPRSPGSPWVIVGQKPGASLSNLDHYWQPIRAQAGLENVRIHDLRHSYASRALALGESLPVIGKLLGHRQVSTTARYVHLMRDAEKDRRHPGGRQHRGTSRVAGYRDGMKLEYRTLSNRTVEKLKVEKDTVFWDRELTGFGVRVYPSGGKVYLAQARGPGGPKRVTVGRHGVIGAEQARQKAAQIIVRVKAGEEPVPESLSVRLSGGPTVGELARRFLEEHVAVRYKPSAMKSTRTAVNRHIVPALGELPLEAVSRARVMELHDELYETPSMANMVVRTLSLMYRLAEGWGLVPEGCNPCRLAVRFPERKRERFLTDGEFTRLGQVLDEVETRGGASGSAVTALRLLMLTGCRKNEILTLRWADVALDEKELRLPDAKTGARVVSLSPSVVKLLSGLPRMEGNPWVIPGRKPVTHMSNLDDAWRVIRARAGLDGVRIHDLRHSFASRALALGESLPMIGKLLGHSQVETTARYAHLARDSVQEAAVRIADSIAADILGEDWKQDSGS